MLASLCFVICLPLLHACTWCLLRYLELQVHLFVFDLANGMYCQSFLLGAIILWSDSRDTSNTSAFVHRKSVYWTNMMRRCRRSSGTVTSKRDQKRELRLDTVASQDLASTATTGESQSVRHHVPG